MYAIPYFDPHFAWLHVRVECIISRTQIEYNVVSQASFECETADGARTIFRNPIGNFSYRAIGYGQNFAAICVKIFILAAITATHSAIGSDSRA
jgi:hypothetical protein